MTIDSAKDPSDSTTGTLGDLLYRDEGKTRVAEAEWVALVHAIAAGDPLALHDLYARTHRLVFTLAIRITNSRETAEELTLDVFHDVWRRAAKYDPAGGTVLGWIMNQARSRAIDRLRFDQRQKRVDPHGHGLPSEAATTSSEEELLDLREQARRLREALAALTPGERQAIETAFFLEVSYAEVALRLNEPLGTVKTRIRSGLIKLREVLAAGVDEP